MEHNFTGLIDDPKDVRRITLSFAVTIQKSFDHDHARETNSEVKRRFEMCVNIFKQLRGDLQWGVQRILEKIPEYLRCELDGAPWTPDQRSMWIPQDS